MAIFHHRSLWYPTFRALSTQSSAKSAALSYGPSCSTETQNKGLKPFVVEPNGKKATSVSSPLASLPASTLLRSAMINTVSSTPWLLSPAIWFLSFLSQPHKSAIFDLDRNALLARVMKQTVYRHFCGGETPVETKMTMRQLRSMGFRGVIITMATEIVYDEQKKEAHGMGVKASASHELEKCAIIEEWYDRTLGAIGLLDEGDQLAIKLTGAGPRVINAFAAGENLPQQMLAALDDICARCKRRGARVLVDAESQLYQCGIFDVGLDLMRKFNTDGHAVVFNTYQAYLKSTLSTVGAHLAAAKAQNFTLGLKLVRGAYISTEKRSCIHDTKQDTDDGYNHIALGAIRGELTGFGAAGQPSFPSVNLILCTHNKDSVFMAHNLHQERLQEGHPTCPVAFAQLQGMADDLSFGLLSLEGSPEVYKCTTWGKLEECLGYLARRATENRDAAGRTQGELVAIRSECVRRVKSAFGLRTN